MLADINAKAEVNELYNCQVLTADDIFHFDVAMGDAEPVKKHQRTDQALKDFLYLLFRKFPLLC